MKHVLVANVYFNPNSFGGATILAENLVDKLVELNQDISFTLLSTQRNESVSGDYSVFRVKLHERVDHFVVRVPHLPPADSFNHKAMEHVFERIAKSTAPDFVHFHCVQDMGANLVLLSKKMGLKTLVSTHDYWWFCHRQFMIDQTGEYCGVEGENVTKCETCVGNKVAFQKRFSQSINFLNQADIVTFPSEFSRSIHLARGVNPTKAYVSKNGVVLPKNDYAKKRHQRIIETKGTAVFGFVGGPGPIKGWAILEKTIEMLSKENVDFKIKLVDAGSKIGRPWWKRHNLSKFGEHIEIVEPYDQNSIDDFFASIDCLLFLSQWKETFGLTVREALVRDTYVIATDSGPAAEDIDHGTTGHILQGFGTANSLKAAMSNFMTKNVNSNIAIPKQKTKPIRCVEEHAAEILNLYKELQNEN